jgi:hypothetical protein
MDCRVKPGNDGLQRFPVTRGLDPRVHHLRKTEGVFRKRMDDRTSFAGMARAGMLACNDHNVFAVIAHGPHCHHRADAVRGGAGAGAATRHERAGSAGSNSAACTD